MASAEARAAAHAALLATVALGRSGVATAARHVTTDDAQELGKRAVSRMHRPPRQASRSFFSAGFRQGRRPALKHGWIEGSDFQKTHVFLGRDCDSMMPAGGTDFPRFLGRPALFRGLREALPAPDGC